MQKKIIVKGDYAYYVKEDDKEVIIALEKSEYEYLLDIRDKYNGKIIPDNYTVKGYKLTKSGINNNIIEYDIIENKLKKYKINELVSARIISYPN